MNNIYAFKYSLLQNNTFSRLSLRQNLIVLDELSSTNDYLKELLSNIKPLREGTAIMARHQTRGRGQRGSTWLTTKDENLTFSVLLYPDNLAVEETFRLNMLICLGIQQALSQYQIEATVKWPNDIYVQDKKIGGILIENKLKGGLIRSSIIGIGLNVNQQSFPAAIAHKATSLRLAKQAATPFPIDEFCISILHGMMQYYQTHATHETAEILSEYNNRLYRKGIPAKFLVQGKEQIGRIVGANAQGKLAVDIEEQRLHFDLKEISFII